MELNKILIVVVVLASFSMRNLSSQSVTIELPVSINDSGQAPRAGSILDMGFSKKPIRIPVLSQDTLNTILKEYGQMVYNIDSSAYQLCIQRNQPENKGSNNINLNTDIIYAQNSPYYPMIYLENPSIIDSVSLYIKSCPLINGPLYLTFFEVDISGNCGGNFIIKQSTQQIAPNQIGSSNWQTLAFNPPFEAEEGKLYIIANISDCECNTTLAQSNSYTPNVGTMNNNNCQLNESVEMNVVFHLREIIKQWINIH